jgi:Zn-dependent M28 family amino/carboxypeptidase
VFVDFFDSLERQTEPTAFDDRSDYDAFVAAGIPAGGLFTGAEDLKTAAQVVKWGGTAGVAFDPCYHQACRHLCQRQHRRARRNVRRDRARDPDVRDEFIRSAGHR